MPSAPALPAPASRGAGITRPLKVAVFLESPFVDKAAGGYEGYAIDLWTQVALSQGWRWTYVEVDTIPKLLQMVNTGQVDVAVSDLFITSARLKLVDFTLPWFDSGLQIMIDERRQQGFRDLVAGLAAGGHLRIFAIVGLILVLASVILTVLDRRLDPEFEKSWLGGVTLSFYHIMQTTMTGNSSHKRMIRGPLGNVLAALWVACGVTVVAYVTSSITSVMTANKIRNEINGPDDLAGKTVGTVLGSTGEAYCRATRLDTQLFNDVKDAVPALLRHQIDGIVYDSPILRYYDNAHPELPITEVGPVFEPQKYGFALPMDSPLRLIIDEQLLKLSENGFTAHLKTRYFGLSTE